MKTEIKYALLIDTSKCFDCKACMIACKVENNVPDGFCRNWVKANSQGIERRTQFQPGQCMQCDQPSCVAACPVNATYIGADGMVEIDKNKCIGCENCVTACPYGARYRNPVKKVADKCDFCMHLVKKGQQPTCVETCPTKARVFGDIKDPNSKISKLLKTDPWVKVVNPLFNTQPNIFYSKGTELIHWPREPKLPGDVHMATQFWKTSS